MPLSASTELTVEIQRELLQLARDAIHSHVRGVLELPDPGDLHGPLGELRAVFVTLKIHGQLRGCIGTLEPRDPLAIAVADSAIGAARRDPRFPPLKEAELGSVVISISVLSPPQPMVAQNRRDLLLQLQPGEDGLVLAQGHHHATFLPQVWEQLPEREEFLTQLLLKAGLPGDHWSPELRLSRYRSFSFTER